MSDGRTSQEVRGLKWHPEVVEQAEKGRTSQEVRGLK